VEVREHEKEADTVRTEGEVFTREYAEASIDYIKLTQQWRELQSRFMQYQKPTEPEQATAPSDGDAVTRTVVSTADVSSIMFSDYSHYEENVRKLLGLLGEVRQGLQAPVLCGREYEEFSQQEDKLKVSAPLSHVLPRLFCSNLFRSYFNSFI